MEDQLRQVARPQEPLKLRRKGLAVSTPGYHTPSKVVVIGGGYAGTVAANHLRMRADVDITLVNPRPEFVERIRLHQFVAEPGEATMNYGIWTAGFGVPELAAASGLLSDELGRLLTDETPTSVDDGRIIAAGDATAPPGRPLRMSCQATQPLRAQAADTVLSRITGNRTGGDQPGLRGVVRQPRPARRHTTALPQRRYRGESLYRRAHGCGDQGGDLQTRGVEDSSRGPQAGFQFLAQGRPASRAAGLCSAGGHVPVTTGELAERFTGVDEHANEKSRLAALGPGRPLHCGIHRHLRLRTEVAHNARRIS